MMMIKAFIVFTAFAAQAETPPAPSSPPAAIEYELLGLTPAGISHYNTPPLGIRQYLHFSNNEGSHYLIYEESPNFPPLKDLVSLRHAMGVPGAKCEISMSCTPKAFCTADCRNLYYEFSNSSAQPGSTSCQLKSFTCENEKPLVPPAPPPASGAPAMGTAPR